MFGEKSIYEVKSIKPTGRCTFKYSLIRTHSDIEFDLCFRCVTTKVNELNVFREVKPSNYKNLIGRQGPISLPMDV